MRFKTLHVLAITILATFVMSTAPVVARADGAVPASVVTPPTPVTGLHDDGTWHELIIPGSSSGGTMQYSLDGVTWWTTIPAATAEGTYTVYYRAVGDSTHATSDTGSVTVIITRPSAGGAQSNITVAASSGARGFVSRLYRDCLGRAADPSGYEFWSSQLQNHRISGMNCAYGFFFSQEFINAHYSDTEYVTKLYNVFLGRQPDTEGFNNWVAALGSGVSRQEVLEGFAHSSEFTRICADYGIERG
ncbi:MAG: DUF4214 domain-containing protein [Clostridiales bacterium]|nr:DUF4214 domain-containing protein [Clostridiales bacterium]